MHLNIQSLRPKLDLLEIESQYYDVIVFTEHGCLEMLKMTTYVYRTLVVRLDAIDQTEWGEV